MKKLNKQNKAENSTSKHVLSAILRSDVLSITNISESKHPAEGTSEKVYTERK